MSHDESLEKGCRRTSHGNKVWYIVGGTVLALVAFGLATSLHDIRRYLAIRRM